MFIRNRCSADAQKLQKSNFSHRVQTATIHPQHSRLHCCVRLSFEWCNLGGAATNSGQMRKKGTSEENGRQQRSKLAWAADGSPSLPLWAGCGQGHQFLSTSRLHLQRLLSSNRTSRTEALHGAAQQTWPWLRQGQRASSGLRTAYRNGSQQVEDAQGAASCSFTGIRAGGNSPRSSPTLAQGCALCCGKGRMDHSRQREDGLSQSRAKDGIEFARLGERPGY